MSPTTAGVPFGVTEAAVGKTQHSIVKVEVVDVIGAELVDA